MAGPEFGPGGYLPQKAAKRARKIVLRGQMGWGWPAAAVAAAILVAATGLLFLRVSSRPPAAPFVALGGIADVDPSGAAVLGKDDDQALVVRAGGVVRAFQATQGVTWCDQSRRLESDGAAWAPDGRTVYGDEPSLTPLRSVVFNGVVYVDPTTPLNPPSPSPGDSPPVCG